MKKVALLIVALALVAPTVTQAATPWNLIGKGGDRNSTTPDASIFAQEVYPGTRLRIVTQATLGGNKLEWKVTCVITDTRSDRYDSSTTTSRGVSWPGKGKHVYPIYLPATPPSSMPVYGPGKNQTPDIVSTGYQIDCYASAYFTGPWGKARTLGVWLQSQLEDES
jgi:hypothetical protein